MDYKRYGGLKRKVADLRRAVVFRKRDRLEDKGWGLLAGLGGLIVGGAFVLAGYYAAKEPRPSVEVRAPYVDQRELENSER